MFTTRFRSVVAYLVVLSMGLFACGGSDGATVDDAAANDTIANADATSGTGGPAEQNAAEQAQDMADSMAESLESQQEAVGGGGATLTVGDHTWSFDSVLCAFGEDQIGQEGAEFVLSSLQDGLQLYVSVDSYGHSVTLDDVSDFENPSVSLAANSFSASMAGESDQFIEVSGKDVRATAPFTDGTSEGAETVTGTLEATCP